MGWASLFLSAKGRVGRGDFWIAWFLLAIASAILRMLGPVGALLSITIAYPQVCLFSKRLHDVGKSGWRAAWVYGFVALGVVAAEVAKAIDAEPAWTDSRSGMVVPLFLAPLAVICMVTALVLFFRAALRRGEMGVNAFGPPAPPILRGFGPKAAEAHTSR